MARDPNSLRSRSNPGDFRLPKSKILRGRRNFQRLFDDAKVYRARNVNLRFKIYPDPSEGCLVGFIVKKKLGNAVIRNRTKRLLREAYRLNQHILSDLFDSGKFGFHGALMANTVGADFESVQKDVIYLLQKVKNHILSIYIEP